MFYEEKSASDHRSSANSRAAAIAAELSLQGVDGERRELDAPLRVPRRLSHQWLRAGDSGG